MYSTFWRAVLTDSPSTDINNVGSIAQALYAKEHTVYDDVEASKWQAAQVSILSLGNFAGRILIGEVFAPLACLNLTNRIPGLISDSAHTRLHLPRAYCLCIVSFLFIISQATAMIVSSVETLWIATLLLGLAYGALFGSYPTIMIEWFGLGRSTFLCDDLICISSHSLYQLTSLKTGATSPSRPSSGATFSPSCLGATWTPMRHLPCRGRVSGH